jgi:rfaE bifunctional protein kinase chain/domain
MRLKETINQFKSRKIVVVGDVIADQFLYGAISRVSREAPVFILRHEQTETLPGGAANAALNVAALGARCILLGIVGADETGRKIADVLKAKGVETKFLVHSKDWQTTTKTRIFAGQPHAPRQQVIRVDYENEKPLAAEIQTEMIRNLHSASENADAIIVSDYNYGAASERVGGELRNVGLKKNIPVFVDSRFRLTDFAGATAATPNEDEVEEVLRKQFKTVSELKTAAAELREKLQLQALLVTRGKNGMILFDDGKTPQHFPVIGSQDAVDVTGAGDTVMAAFALAAASGATFAEAATLANHAGGLVVMKRGTATVSEKELLNSILS